MNPTRFRGDLEALAQTDRFSILRMPFSWQARFLPRFYGSSIPPLYFREVASQPDVASAATRYRDFIGRTFRRLKNWYGIDCVVSAAIHYVQDHDWGIAARAEGVPYLVLHREGTVTSPKAHADQVDFYRRFEPFWGDHLVVANEAMRRVFTESGFVDPDRITVGGVLRMDNFVRRVNSDRGPERAKPQVVLFSFIHTVGMGPNVWNDPARSSPFWSESGELGFRRLFERVHRAVARYARDNPGVRVIIKAKWGGTWIDRIRATLEQDGIAVEDVPNLTVTDDGDAQDLILDSRVVIGFGSTTLLEGAIANRPVILPVFAEARDERHSGYVAFQDEKGIFDVAESEDDLVDLIRQRLNEPAIPEATRQLRRTAFERYISSADGEAHERFTRVLLRYASAEAPVER